METLLMSIQTDITQYVGMMSMIFSADVDVADQNLIRVAGTGRFARRIGSSLHSGRVSARVLETGRPIFIKDPEMEPLCQNCLNLSVCKDQCELRVPIKLDMEVIGTLGIASSSPEQYTEIIGRYEQMFVFANHMASLIALKAVSYTHLHREHPLRAGRRYGGWACLLHPGVCRLLRRP